MDRAKKSLRSLEEVNAYRTTAYFDKMKPFTSGIACPKCGVELHEHHHVIHTYEPPRTQVSCPSCSWKGTVVA